MCYIPASMHDQPTLNCKAFTTLLYSTALPLWISGLNNKIDREISKDLKWNWSRQHFPLSTLFNILVHGTCCWYLTFQSASYDGSWLTSPPVACVVELWLWPTRNYIWHLLSHIQHRLGGMVRIFIITAYPLSNRWPRAKYSNELVEPNHNWTDMLGTGHLAQKDLNVIIPK